MRKHRILFVEQYYFPEGWGGAELPRLLTTTLAAHGFDVEVICGSDQYSPELSGETADPRSAGVRLRRVQKIVPGPAVRFKLLRQMWFYFGASFPMLLRVRLPDLLMIQTNPPFVVILCAAIARLWRRPIVIIAMDIYPEVIAASGIVKGRSLAYRILSGAFRWAYRSAAAVVALGPVMSEKLVVKGVSRSRIVEIQNWSTGASGLAPADQNPLRKAWNLSGKFVILYSGNLGVAHEFDTFLQGFATAVDIESTLHLVVIGAGSRLREVRKSVTRLSLDKCVTFDGFVPSEQLPLTLGLADVALVTLRPGFEGLVVPSKLYSYLSRGLPVLYVGPRSDTSVVLEETGGGECVLSGQPDDVARCILKWSSDKLSLGKLADDGRASYERYLGAERSLQKYAKLAAQLLNAP